MSQPVPVHADSPRLCIPACALLHMPRCLTASQVVPPVHGVFTTRATTTPTPLSAPADWPRRRSGMAARYHLSSPWPITMRSAAQIAEYEREDCQARALLEMRILANSVSGQAAEPTATVAGGSAGMTHPRTAASGQDGCVLAVIFPRTVGVAGCRDVNDNRHSRGDGWAAGQPVGALEEAGLAVSSRAGRSEGGVDGADRAGAVAHRGGDAFH